METAKINAVQYYINLSRAQTSRRNRTFDRSMTLLFPYLWVGRDTYHYLYLLPRLGSCRSGQRRESFFQFGKPKVPMHIRRTGRIIRHSQSTLQVAMASSLGGNWRGSLHPFRAKHRGNLHGKSATKSNNLPGGTSSTFRICINPNADFQLLPTWEHRIQTDRLETLFPIRF